MRRIKLGKGLLRSLFPSSSKNKKKKSPSSSNKNPSSSGGTASNNTPANKGSSSSFNCPRGGSRRKNEQNPYELHQEGASSPPPSDDEGRDHENTFGCSGVGEKELQLTSQQQQQQHDVKREETVITPITVACSSTEDHDNEEGVEACYSTLTASQKVAKYEGEHEATEEKELDEDNEYCVPQPTQQLVEDGSIGSPTRDDARRRAAARQQRILSQASTRFQSLSETATIDTSEFQYCSPPHLQRRRWQHHIGRQSKPQASGDDGNQQVSLSQGQSIIGLPPRHQQQQQQQPLTNNTKCSSIVFYDSTPTRPPATISSGGNKSSCSCSDLSKKEGPLPSPTCVADMEQFGVTTPGPDKRGTASGNSSICTSTTTDKGIYFFVLLLCPKSRIFEVIEVSDAPLDSTVGDVLKLIPRNITDGRLLKKKYIGLCRPADRTEFIDLSSPAFLSQKERQGEDNTPFDFIHENDVLVAILKGSTCYQMSKISKPILRNPKFKEMVRRRRRQSAADKAARKKKRKSKKKQNDKLRSPTKEIYVPDDCSVVSGITCAKPKRSHKEDPTSLSKMLETLSKKLHEVEEDGAFLPADDNSSIGSCSKRSVATDLDQAKGRSQDGEKIGFRMSPKLLAMELAQTIEDIFADNNVEIVAVDAGDDDGDDSRTENNNDTDSDTFVSARSHRTQSTHLTSSTNATRKSAKMPRNIVTTKKHRTKTSPRQFKFTETMEDNALAAQIEAMAVQADAAFEDRSKKNSSRIASRATVAIDRSNNASPLSTASPLSDGAAVSIASPLSDDVAVSLAAADSNAQDLSESFQTTFDAVSHIEIEIEREDAEVVAKATKRPSKDNTTRTFLNATTSTVSKMVADNQGRVNEMHVLESLGCTIVCIAANYMQGNRQKEQQKPSIETTDLFQSATFLAFMVSGQRYLAKVTEK